MTQIAKEFKVLDQQLYHVNEVGKIALKLFIHYTLFSLHGKVCVGEHGIRNFFLSLNESMLFLG